MLTIRLPFPNPALNPNRSSGHHWAAQRGLRDKTKQDGFYATKEVMGNWKPQCGDIPMTITYVVPDNRRRDRDNLLASSKNTLDGIAMALGVDDSRFEPLVIKRMVVKGRKEMIVEVGGGSRDQERTD